MTDITNQEEMNQTEEQLMPNRDDELEQAIEQPVSDMTKDELAQPEEQVAPIRDDELFQAAEQPAAEKKEERTQPEEESKAKTATAALLEGDEYYREKYGDKTADEFIQEYEALKEKVYKMDSVHPSDEDRQTLKDYAEHQEILNHVRDSVDFLKASTFLTKDDDDIACHSLLESKEQYTGLMAQLTNNSDKKFMEAVEETRDEQIQAGGVSRLVYLASAKAPLMMPEMSESMNEEISQNKERKMSEVFEAVEQADRIMDEYSIDREAIVASTIERFTEYNENAQTTVLAREEDNIAALSKEDTKYFIVAYNEQTDEEHQLHTNDFDAVKKFAVAEMLNGADVTILDTQEDKEVTLEADQFKEHYNIVDLARGYFPVEPENLEEVDYENNHKPPKPVEIVESSDGYVMAASEVTAENEAEFNSRVNKTNNEVIHNEAPQETTIDPSAVGGKVKLEAAEDLGSREMSQIENGGGAYGNLESRYENTKIDETPDYPEDEEQEQEAEEQEAEEQEEFSGYDDIV